MGTKMASTYWLGYLEKTMYKTVNQTFEEDPGKEVLINKLEKDTSTIAF